MGAAVRYKYGLVTNVPPVRGTVRLGTPEDFATLHLPSVLARFAQAYPSVALEVSCDLTLNLLDRFRKGAFDLALVKRERASDSAGIRVWRILVVNYVTCSLLAAADMDGIPVIVSAFADLDGDGAQEVAALRQARAASVNTAAGSGIRPPDRRTVVSVTSSTEVCRTTSMPSRPPAPTDPATSRRGATRRGRPGSSTSARC